MMTDDDLLVRARHLHSFPRRGKQILTVCATRAVVSVCAGAADERQRTSGRSNHPWRSFLPGGMSKTGTRVTDAAAGIKARRDLCRAADPLDDDATAINNLSG